MSLVSEDNLETERYKEILKANGVLHEIKNITVVKPNLSGDQMGSSCSLVTIHFDEEKLDPLELFVKKALKHNEYANILRELFVFEKEAQFFNNILKDIEALCNEKLGSTDFLTGLTPQCYFSDENLVVLENLSKKAYTMKDKKESHSFAQARLVMENIARFHAVSYSLIQEKGLTKTLEKYPFLETNYIMSEHGEKIQGPWTHSMVESSLSILEANPVPGSEKLSGFLKELQASPGPYNRFCKLFKLDNQSCANVLNHGDLWNANMMFMNLTADEAEKCVFIDFQTIHIGSPVLDLQYYMNVAISGPLRREVWKELLNIYYEDFKAQVERFGYQIDFSFSTFVNEYRQKCEPGFMLGLYLIFGWDSMDQFGDLEKVDGNVVDHVASVTKNQASKYSSDKGIQVAQKMVTEFQEYQKLISERD